MSSWDIYEDSSLSWESIGFLYLNFIWTVGFMRVSKCLLCLSGQAQHLVHTRLLKRQISKEERKKKSSPTTSISFLSSLLLSPLSPVSSPPLPPASPFFPSIFSNGTFCSFSYRIRMHRMDFPVNCTKE